MQKPVFCGFASFSERGTYQLFPETKKNMKNIEERRHATHQDPQITPAQMGQGFQTQEEMFNMNTLRTQNSPFQQMGSGKVLCRISLVVLEQLKMY